MDSIKLQIPSLIENLKIIESFIDNAKERFNLDDDIYGNIMIAVTESVHNAIKHGNACDRDKTVNLSLLLENGSIKFTISDEGGGFDYHNLPDPTAPDNVENPGGRGIFLMKNLSDEVNFSQEGTCVELVFYLN